jgi:hypothetical protein
MDVWFCVMRRNRAERLNRESMNRLKKKLGALPSAKRILAPLDKDLSWMSAGVCWCGWLAGTNGGLGMSIDSQLQMIDGEQIGLQ